MNHPRITPTRHDLAAHTLARKLPPISRSQPLQWARTDHGALADRVGDGVGNISHLRLIRSDGSEQLLPTAPAAMPPASRMTLAADPAAEMWHTPAHRAHSNTRITTAPQAARPARPASTRQRPITPAPDRIPTWLLGVAALLFVAALALSSVYPWGFGVALWK